MPIVRGRRGTRHAHVPAEPIRQDPEETSDAGLAAAAAFPGGEGSWAPAPILRGLTEDWKDRVVLADDGPILDGIETFWIGCHTPCSQAIRVRTDIVLPSHDPRVLDRHPDGVG